MENNLLNTVKDAKNATYALAATSTAVRNNALNAVADAIEANKDMIFAANNKDLAEGQKLLDEGKISKALFGRLKLDENKMRDMIAGIRDMIKLEDPVNKCLRATELDEGLNLYKMTCPIGLIGVIFEARPDVIAQISALAIKSANVVLLKGGREGQNTNTTVAEIINKALDNVEGFPKNVINLIYTREEVAELLKMDDYIDLLIPRGGNSLVKYIKDNTKIPVLGHADGICHVYVDKCANFEKALKICLDSKIQYPSACNAVETVLVHNAILAEFLPLLVKLYKDNDVAVKADRACHKICSDTELTDDWAVEYSDKIVAIKAVEDINDAIDHINYYGSGHTDSIITEDVKNGEMFMNLVDSAGVFQNASTRFSDGFRYGLGAEVGISTNKTHARGPVGLEGLVIYKYKLYGSGQIVDDYCQGKKTFTHKDLC